MKTTVPLNVAVILLLIVLDKFCYIDAQEDGAVRLVNGPAGVSVCGRVEVFHNGEWGTVCDDRWNSANGDVVCKQLGYVRAEQIFYLARFGRGTGPIWMDGVQCDDGQSSLAECRHNGWGVHDCAHSEDAGVCCEREQAAKPETLPVRLQCPHCNVGGNCNACPEKTHPDTTDCFPRSAVRGIVEVQVNGIWGTVSAEGWGWTEATVLCGQLGYPMAYFSSTSRSLASIWPNYVEENDSEEEPLCTGEALKQTASLRNRLNSTLLQGVECTGRESTIHECYIAGVGSRPNPLRDIATVQCAYFPHTACYSSFLSETYRLRGGAVPWSGRVEVRINNEWGTVCDTGFDEKEGNIVCRSLGYGTVKRIVGRAGYGRGIGAIHLTQLRCSGSEFTLTRCGHVTGNAALACTHGGDVGIECNVPNVIECDQHTGQLHDVRLYRTVNSNNSAIVRSYPEIKGSAGWGVLCYSEEGPSIDTLVGEVICKQTKSMFLSKISRSGHPAGLSGRAFYNGTIECTGDEAKLSDCSVDVVPTGWCPGMYTTIDCTMSVPDLVPDLYRFRRSLESRGYVDRIPLYYLSCALDEGCLSSSAVGAPNTDLRYLLRFDSLTMNWGLYEFLPVLAREDWLWHSCHNHYHSMEAFVQYDLLDITTGQMVAEGHKASFCLEDSTCARGYSGHFKCYLGIQGISVNCGDLYSAYLDCQWIDITGISGGEYIVRHRVNPERLVIESDYRNNEVSCRITLSADLYAYTVRNCWLSDHDGTPTRQ